MQWDNRWRELDAETQLTYLIGAVARASVQLDATSRATIMALHETLETPEHLQKLDKPMASRLKKARQLVERHDLLQTPEYSAAALGALDNAGSAYERRNRYIHDDLMPSTLEVIDQFPTEEPLPSDERQHDRWAANRLDLEPGTTAQRQDHHSLDDLEMCEIELVKTTWQLWGLRNTVMALRAGSAEHVLMRWHVLLRGDINVHADGSISWGY